MNDSKLIAMLGAEMRRLTEALQESNKMAKETLLLEKRRQMMEFPQSSLISEEDGADDVKWRPFSDDEAPDDGSV